MSNSLGLNQPVLQVMVGPEVGLVSTLLERKTQW